MGVKEDELARIAASGPFDVPELAAVRNSLLALAATMKRIAASDGWEGLSAQAASDKMEALSVRYYEVDGLVGQLERVVRNANVARQAALEAAANLPAATAPSWVHGALDIIDFPGIPQPVDLAQGGLSIIENFLGGQRENAAAAIVATYANQLEAPKHDALEVRGELLVVIENTREADDDPYDGIPPQPDGPSSTPYVPYVPGDGGGSGHVGQGSFSQVHGGVIGIDNPTTGILPPTTVTPPPPPPPPTVVTCNVGTPLPGQVAGAGLGTALTGASTAAALKLGAGSPMIAGSAARLGTGGLLGAAGAPGSTGMVGGAGTAGAAAGTRPGMTAMRGGSGLLGGTNVGGGGAGGAGGTNVAGAGTRGVGGANAADKKRRAAGKGLGGPMAPKLDDEAEYVRQAPGARAGERIESADATDAVDSDA